MALITLEESNYIGDDMANINANFTSLNSDISGKQKQTWQYTSDPTVNNDSANTAGVGGAFRAGDMWINTSTDIHFICLDASVGAADWQAISTSLTSDTTVNLNSSMSSVQIQALIDVQPKDLGGNTITFQFADGTYTLTTTLSIQHFYGGLIRVQGNASDTTLSTTKSVSLNFGSNDGILINGNSYTIVTALKITVTGSAGGAIPISVFNTSCLINANVCIGDSTAAGSAVRVIRGTSEVSNTYVSNVYLGIQVNNALVFVNNNDDTGTQPDYGLVAGNAGAVGKLGTQPTGSVSNELLTPGGEIRA